MACSYAPLVGLLKGGMVRSKGDGAGGGAGGAGGGGDGGGGGARVGEVTEHPPFIPASKPPEQWSRPRRCCGYGAQLPCDG